MANLSTIPAGEQEGVLSTFWFLLRECESKADGPGNQVLKNQVEGAYVQWNRITGQDHKPSWATRK